MALEHADEKNLITFGIRPDFPATGFGYVAVDKDQKDSQLKKVTAFTEKPDKATAQCFSMIKLLLEFGDICLVCHCCLKGSKPMPLTLRSFPERF